MYIKISVQIPETGKHLFDHTFHLRKRNYRVYNGGQILGTRINTLYTDSIRLPGHLVRLDNTVMFKALQEGDLPEVVFITIYSAFSEQFHCKELILR